MEIEEIKKTIAQILKQELAGTDYHAFFFGSRITGTATPTSDLDVGLEGTKALPDDLLLRIKSRTESIPTLYTIDIVDFAHVGDEFKQVAKEKIEPIC